MASWRERRDGPGAPGDGPGGNKDRNHWKKRPGRSSTSSQRGKQHKFNREQATVFSIQSLGQFRFVRNNLGSFFLAPERSWYHSVPAITAIAVPVIPVSL